MLGKDYVLNSTGQPLETEGSLQLPSREKALSYRHKEMNLQTQSNNWSEPVSGFLPRLECNPARTLTAAL